MTSPPKALDLAIDIYQAPSRVHGLRAHRLPEDVALLLRLVAGDAEAMQDAIAISGRSQQTVRGAAEFFIVQVMFAANSDSYRLLGAHRNASAHELRRNMALLSRWLHPDARRDAVHSLLSLRVTEAWDNIKTPERRVVYDKAREFRANSMELGDKPKNDTRLMARSLRPSRPTNGNSLKKIASPRGRGDAKLTTSGFWLRLLARFQRKANP